MTSPENTTETQAGQPAETAPWHVVSVPVEKVYDLRLEVLRPGQPPSTARFDTDACAGAFHVAALDAGGQVIGVGSLHCEDRDRGVQPMLTPGIRIRGMAVRDEFRGRGVGSALLRELLSQARVQDVAELWANARLPALSLYLRAGFEVVSEPFEVPSIGPHVVVARALVGGTPSVTASPELSASD